MDGAAVTGVDAAVSDMVVLNDVVVTLEEQNSYYRRPFYYLFIPQFINAARLPKSMFKVTKSGFITMTSGYASQYKHNHMPVFIC